MLAPNSPTFAQHPQVGHLNLTVIFVSTVQTNTALIDASQSWLSIPKLPAFRDQIYSEATEIPFFDLCR